ncbi:hypothetical protein EDC04DRAFT_2576223, partial [Pisolithus marmoratus]
EKSDTKLLNSDADPAYTDLPEVKDSRNGGAQMHPLLRQGSRCCRLKGKEEIVTCIGSKGCHQIWASPQNRQRVLGHLAKCTYTDAKLRQKCIEALSSKAIGPIPEMGFSTMEMDVKKVPVPLVQTKKRNLGNAKLTTIITNEGKKKQKEKNDYHLMKCIVCCGIPPKVVDSAEWKEMMAALNPYYQPPSSTTLTEKLIVNEAAKITAAIDKFLAGCRNLTITFDGSKIRRPKSTYSVHVTTATRRAFCMELDDMSQLSHTAKYILEVISRVRTILAFMSHSTYTMEHFNYQRSCLGIRHGLEYIGKTRFGTIYWSALSIQCGLPAFTALVESGINITGLNALFMPGRQRLLFEVALSKSLQATGPWAKGLHVLEAADVTADHIYYVFLGIMSQHEEDFRKNEFGLELRMMEDIRHIANNRFNELVNETPQSHDLYITAFVCNPDYRNAPVYKEINPLAMPTIVISQIEGSVACSTKPPKDMVERAGLGLQRILRHEYGDVYEVGSSATDPTAAMRLWNPALSKYIPFDALNRLHLQFKSYLNAEDPFNHKRCSKQSTLQWWAALAGDELADVLVPVMQKIFSVVPISMTDECMQSTITWLNSPHRHHQNCINHIYKYILISQPSTV